MVDYKFREDQLLQELQEYVDSTYKQHYATGNIQSTEVIVDRGRGLDFCLGNIDKYSNRYGSKGTADDYRKDLIKILHYGLIALYSHDRKMENEVVTDVDQGYDLSEMIDYDELDVTTITIGDVKIGD